MKPAIDFPVLTVLLAALALAACAGGDQVEQTALAQPAAEQAATPAAAPAARGSGWSGSISVTTTKHVAGKNPNGEPFTEDGSAQLQCTFTGQGENAVCGYESQDSLVGSGTSMKTTQHAADYSTSVGISVREGKLTISTAVIPVTGTQTVTIAGQTITSETGNNLTNAHYVLPAGPDPNRQAGTWTDPDPNLARLGARIVVSWDLARR